MKIIKGIYAEAKIFTEDVDEYAEAQVKMICDNEVADQSRICMMPDIHPGKIAPIGLSMTVTDKVIPQLLGVDIGCGMTCVKVNKERAEFQKLDKVIREIYRQVLPFVKRLIIWRKSSFMKGFIVLTILIKIKPAGVWVRSEAVIIL